MKKVGCKCWKQCYLAIFFCTQKVIQCYKCLNVLLPDYQQSDICYALNTFCHRKKTAVISKSSLCLQGVRAPCHSCLASQYLVSKAPRSLYVVSSTSEEQTQDIMLGQHRSIDLGALGLFFRSVKCATPCKRAALCKAIPAPEQAHTAAGPRQECLQPAKRGPGRWCVSHGCLQLSLGWSTLTCPHPPPLCCAQVGWVNLQRSERDGCKK